MGDLKEIRAIWRGEVTHALKSGRVVVLLALYVVFTVLALVVMGWLNVSINDMVSPEKLQAAGATLEQVREQMLAQKKQFLGVLFDEPVLSSLLPLPLVLLFVFKISMLFVPLFVALMGFDQLSGDVGPKSIRYYVVRVKRSSLVVGRFLTQLTLYCALIATTLLLMTVVAKALNAEFGYGEAARWFLKLLLVAGSFGLAYVGLTALCSSAVRSSPISLTLNVMALFVLWVDAFVFGRFFLLPGEQVEAHSLSSLLKSESAWGYLRYSSVWQFEPSLLNPQWPVAVSAALVHVGFALCCLGAAVLIVGRRDV